MIPTWAEEIRLKFTSKVKGDELVLRTCPYCHNTHWNCQISLSLCVIHCWVCGVSKSAQNFMKEQDISFDKNDVQPRRREKKERGEIILPKGPLLYSDTSKAGTIAKSYLYSRGVTDKTIEDWRFILATGEDANILKWDYFSYVVAPLYGLYGLESFIAAKYMDGKGYKLPPAIKDVFVPKRREAKSIVLVEGLFDATAVWQATEHDVLMLMGKYLLSEQATLLGSCNYERVFICLDGDAKKEGMSLCWRLARAGMAAYFVDLPKDKDPNDLKDGVREYINKALPYSMQSGIGAKLDRIKSIRTL